MKHLSLSPALYDYMLDISLDEHPVMKALRIKNNSHPLAVMQVAPEQAQFMQFLLRLIRAKNVLELGTFTGYSALAMALALPKEGKLITCDINQEWTQDAPRYWQEAGVLNKIDLKLAPALQTLNGLLAQDPIPKFDFIFIDADKTNYLSYYEIALQLISEGGIIAIDNIFWEGLVIDPEEKGAQTREIRKLNALIKEDKRVDKILLPIADGLFLLQKSTAKEAHHDNGAY